MVCPDPVSFVPAVCEALKILSCFTNKDCKFEGLDLDGLDFAGDLVAGELGTLALTIQALDVCIIAGIAQAFIDQGCPMPALPDKFVPPDPSECTDDIKKMVTEAETSLGVLEGVVFIDQDDNGNIIRIRTV